MILKILLYTEKDIICQLFLVYFFFLPFCFALPPNCLPLCLNCPCFLPGLPPLLLLQSLFPRSHRSLSTSHFNCFASGQNKHSFSISDPNITSNSNYNFPKVIFYICFTYGQYVQNHFNRFHSQYQ